MECCKLGAEELRLETNERLCTRDVRKAGLLAELVVSFRFTLYQSILPLLPLVFNLTTSLEMP